MSDNPSKPVELSGDEKASLVEKKATCPFIGSAPAQGELPVRNDAKDPLASIEDVRRLGNTGGGDLGDLLVLFAQAATMCSCWVTLESWTSQFRAACFHWSSLAHRVLTQATVAFSREIRRKVWPVLRLSGQQPGSRE